MSPQDTTTQRHDGFIAAALGKTGREHRQLEGARHPHHNELSGIAAMLSQAEIAPFTNPETTNSLNYARQ